MSFFEKLAKVVQGIGPIVSGLISFFVPAIAPVATVVSAALPKLIDAAEEVIGSGNGEVKKEIVMTGAQAIVDGMSKLSTGGQAETWEKLSPLTSVLVDAIVAGTKTIKTWDDENAAISAG